MTCTHGDGCCRRAPDCVRARSRRLYLSDPEKHKAIVRAHYWSHPERARAEAARRMRESRRRRQAHLLLTREAATRYARGVLKRIWISDEDLEDLVSEAYLAYWRGWLNTGHREAAAFGRDVVDAWRAWTGSRKKSPRPQLVTNVEDGWFESLI
jgi:hypothetical protein